MFAFLPAEERSWPRPQPGVKGKLRHGRTGGPSTAPTPQAARNVPAPNARGGPQMSQPGDGFCQPPPRHRGHPLGCPKPHPGISSPSDPQLQPLPLVPAQRGAVPGTPGCPQGAGDPSAGCGDGKELTPPWQPPLVAPFQRFSHLFAVVFPGSAALLLNRARDRARRGGAGSAASSERGRRTGPNSGGAKNPPHGGFGNTEQEGRARVRTPLGMPGPHPGDPEPAPGGPEHAARCLRGRCAALR